MNDRAKIEMLLCLKRQHGDLNTALVALYRRAYGPVSIQATAEALGLNRSVVRRALRLGVSESDTKGD